MNVRVLTDSDTGLQGQLANEFGIVILPHYLIHGGKSYRELDLPRERMIAWLEEEDEVTSSHPTVHDYVSAFQDAGRSDNGILYLPISAQYSKAYDVSLAVRERLSGSHITIVDSQRAVGGHAMFALEAVRLAISEDSPDRIVQKMKVIHERVNEIMVLDSLRQLVHEGRARNVEGAMTSLVSTKLLVANRGLATPIGKVRTNTQALEAIIAKIKKDLAHFDTSDIRILIEYGTDEELAERVKEDLVSLFSPSKLWALPISPSAMLRIGTTGWSVSWSVVS